MLSNQTVIENFINNVESHNRNLRSSVCGGGYKLINYYTTIAQKIGGVIVVNGTRYSVSTSKIQHYLRSELFYRAYVELKDIPVGTNDLTKYYEKYLKEQGEAA